MNCTKQKLINLAETFVKVPSFLLAYGVFIKLHEHDETENFKLYVLSKLLEFCMSLYNTKRNFFNLINYWDLSQRSIQEILNCFFCKMILKQPITLLCGHTYCRKCVDFNYTCHLCENSKKVDYIGDCIVLSKAIKLLFPTHVFMYKKLTKAKKLLEQGLIDDSLKIYDEVINESKKII